MNARTKPQIKLASLRASAGCRDEYAGQERLPCRSGGLLSLGRSGWGLITNYPIKRFITREETSEKRATSNYNRQNTPLLRFTALQGTTAASVTIFLFYSRAGH